MGEYVLYERSFIIVSTIKAFHEDRIDMDDPQQMTSSNNNHNLHYHHSYHHCRCS